MAFKPFYDQLSVSFKDPKQHVVHVDGLLHVSSVRDLVTMLKMEISRGAWSFRVSAEPGRSLDRVVDIIWVLKGRGTKERKHQMNE